MATNTKQKEYQRNYDKKTKMISVKYALHEMDDYDRFMQYAKVGFDVEKEMEAK